ncbi:fructose-specific PTS transporter subunit EIIC [Irregularibacter muris]|uniref:Fructose-specific PTS transporter subunit EIIC n=1 Tax=Irregularibacter muris TaxID=1796619 RepID=A0AAE3HEJ1_9FIRM|nr:fructose-specific PTS transporter subunit EIIC [Irregularibacter muris]MCR1899106.1 fructose-specific PTS transporter subunit EIIC [Irregularibacter muris]
MLKDGIFSKSLITTSLKTTTKKDIIRELSEFLVAEGRITNKEEFIQDVFKREAQIPTALEEGIAIPHAKSKTVKQASIVVGISKKGVDFGATDHKLSKIFFLIATPENTNDLHIKALSDIASKVLDKSFREKLLNAQSNEEIFQLLMQSNEPTKDSMLNSSGRFFIGITGCPVGVAHTYLAAKSLQNAANELGVDIKVETNGSIGVENAPTQEEIDKAEAIIIACDKEVDLERFHGKKVIFTGTKEAIDKPKELIQKVMNAHIPIYLPKTKNLSNTTEKNAPKQSVGLYKYLMNGVSFMIPFVVTGGLLIALSLTLGGEPTPGGLQIPAGSFWDKISQIGVTAFTLMIPILAGYIAYAIGDRAALAPGMVGGWIANNGSFYGAEAGTGFIGAIVAGLIVGYLVKWMKSLNYPKAVQALVPIMIIPIIGSVAIGIIFIYGIGAPISSLMDSLNAMLQSLSSGSFILIGLVMGLMQGFDMGGPFGKVVFMFSVGLIGTGQTQFMGAQAVAIPVAPLGMAIATFVGKKYFDKEEIANGKAALAMGLVGISEGAIPFAASDPLAVIPANMIGSAVACILGFLWGITDSVAHGGPIVALLGAMNKPIMALFAMLIGSCVTAAIVIFFKKSITRKPKISSMDKNSEVKYA